MARKLSKCVALAPLATVNDPTVDTAGDYRRQDVQSFFSFDADADGGRTSWIRVWADWFDIQGDGPDQLRTDLLDALAANVEAARNAGKRVILTSRSYPLWSNNTASIPETDADSGFDPNAPGWLQTLPDRRRGAGGNTKLRRFRFPGDAMAGSDSIDVGVGSDWYVWIKFLAIFFNPLRDGIDFPEPYKSLLKDLTIRPAAFVDHLEFVNEPNAAEGWPQLDGAGNIVSAAVVSEMFVTVNEIIAELGATPGPVFVGPASSDVLVTTSDQLNTSVDDFTDALLTNLGAANFVPGKRVAWSTHNYTDVTRGCWTMPKPGGVAPVKKGKKDPSTNRAQLVRGLLRKHGWAGWPKGTAGNPRMLLTEGGVQRAKLRPKAPMDIDTLHANLLADAGKRLRDEDGFGAGIDMFTHFLFYTTTDFDSGLVDVPATPGMPAPADVEKLKRKAYYVWRSLSETRI